MQPQDLQEAIRQISQSLKKLDGDFEKRTKAVNDVCGKWEQRLTRLLAESRDTLEEMKEVRDSLHWKRRTLIAMTATGFIGGVALLLLSLCLPGVNSLVYKLLLILGR